MIPKYSLSKWAIVKYNALLKMSLFLVSLFEGGGPRERWKEFF